MEDRFLHDLRRDPDPGFETSLRARLRAQQAAPPGAGVRWRPLAVAAAFAIAIGGSFAFPSVRAFAGSFLDIFRVRTFTPVAVDPERFRVLDGDEVDLRELMAKRIEVLEKPGEPQPAANAAEAARLAGFAVAEPARLPAGLEPGAISVSGASLARLTADASILEEILRLLDIHDVQVPANLDGAQVQLRMAPAVQMLYAKEGRKVRFMQSMSPDVRLPPAMDLEDLGRIALRIAGLSPAEAQRLAHSIDWHTTLLVPVPTSVSSFRNVTVHGTQALLIHADHGNEDIPAGRRGGNALMWAVGGKVYALAGNLNEADLLEMAQSVR